MVCSHTGLLRRTLSDLLLTVEIVPPAEPGTMQIVAAIAGLNLEANEADNTVTLPIEVVTPPDISVTLSGPESVSATTTLRYRVQVNNHGESEGRDVNVTGNVLPGTVVRQFTIPPFTTRWSCQQETDVFTCTDPRLPVGAAMPLEIIVDAQSELGPVSLTAEVTTVSADPNLLNNIDTSPLLVEQRAHNKPFRLEIEGASQTNTSMAISPSGTSLYVLTATLDLFQRDPETGTLTAGPRLSNDDFENDALLGPRDIAISPDGRHVYVTTHRLGISVFTRDVETGTLTFSSRITLEGLSFPPLLSPLSLAASPDGNHLAVSLPSGFRTIVLLRRNVVNGELEVVDETNALNVILLEFSPDSRHLYAVQDLNIDGAILSYAVSGVGQLTAFEPIPVPGPPSSNDPVQGFVLSPDGAHVYLFQSERPGTIYERDHVTGELSLAGTFEGIGAFPRNPAFGSNDGYLYIPTATSSIDQSLRIYFRDRTTGALTLVEELQEFDGSLNLLSGIQQVLTDPSGLHLYAVTFGQPNAVVQFERDGGSPFIRFIDALSPTDRERLVPGSFAGSPNPSGIEIHFNQAVANPPGHNELVDVTNPEGYRILTPGPNGVFDLERCGDVIGDDTRVLIRAVAYDFVTSTATLNFDVPTLPDGLYRLVVCTSAVVGVNGHALAGNTEGGDYLADLEFSNTNDLAISSLDGTADALLNDTHIISLLPQNLGPTAAASVMVSIDIPDTIFATIVSASSTGWSCTVQPRQRDVHDCRLFARHERADRSRTRYRGNWLSTTHRHHHQRASRS